MLGSMGLPWLLLRSSVDSAHWHCLVGHCTLATMCDVLIVVSLPSKDLIVRSDTARVVENLCQAVFEPHTE